MYDLAPWATFDIANASQSVYLACPYPHEGISVLLNSCIDLRFVCWLVA